MEKHCDFCHRSYRTGEHDPCLANLPGIAFACCGHGKTPGYLSFVNGLYVEIDTHRIGRMIPVVDARVPAVTPKAPNTEAFWGVTLIPGK